MRKLALKLFCLILSLSFVVPPSMARSVSSSVAEDPHAQQAANILGIGSQVDRLLQIRSSASPHDPDVLALRGLILRKILLGTLEVRQACSAIDAELAYTYELSQKERHRQDTVNELFNLTNFVQFGTLYSLEGRSRNHKQFVQSAILTCTSAGLGTALPITNILYGKLAKAKNVAPPKFFAHVINGGPVDTNVAPQLVQDFLNTPRPGSSIPRAVEMHDIWKQRYGVNVNKKDELASLLDGKSKSLNQLNTRIMLLWSLHTYIQEFDKELFTLLQLIETPAPQTSNSTSLTNYNIGADAAEAAHLLNIEPQVCDLIAANQGKATPATKLELETYLLEQILLGHLDLQMAANRIDQELNYAYDVVLSELITRRNKWLQLNFEANFLHNGIMGATAGYLYLKKYPKAGDEMFVISSSIGVLLSSLALLQMHGGWRKIDTPPNSLADFFGLEPSPEYRYSALTREYLSIPSHVYKPGKSRRDWLYDIWKNNKVATINVHNSKNQAKLAAMPNIKSDTIKIVHNRIVLLSSLQVMFESFAPNLHALLVATNPSLRINDSNQYASADLQGLSKYARTGAKLLNAEPQIESLLSLKKQVPSSNTNLIEQQLALTRQIISAMLEVRMTAANLDIDIATETQNLNRLLRQRDFATQLTNVANFYQINILGIIIDGPLGLSSKEKYQTYDNNLTIVSGLLAIGLGSAAFLERKGGIRLSKAEPNMLGPCFNLDSSAKARYSPLLLKFLNSPSPATSGKLSRREELIEYWKRSKLLDLNVKKVATAQKVSATGPKHHWWNETIKLLKNRVDMLYDVKAVVDIMDIDLGELLNAMDA